MRERAQISSQLDAIWQYCPIVLDLRTIKAPEDRRSFLVKPGQILENGQFLWTTEVDLSADFPGVRLAMAYKILNDYGGIYMVSIASSGKIARFDRSKIDDRDYYFPSDQLSGARIWRYAGWAPVPEILGE